MPRPTSRCPPTCGRCRVRCAAARLTRRGCLGHRHQRADGDGGAGAAEAGVPEEVPIITRDMVAHAKPDPDLFLACSRPAGRRSGQRLRGRRQRRGISWPRAVPARSASGCCRAGTAPRSWSAPGRIGSTTTRRCCSPIWMNWASASPESAGQRLRRALVGDQVVDVAADQRGPDDRYLLRRRKRGRSPVSGSGRRPAGRPHGDSAGGRPPGPRASRKVQSRSPTAPAATSSAASAASISPMRRLVAAGPAYRR